MGTGVATEDGVAAARQALWDEVIGQPAAVAVLRAAVPQPTHAYLLVGPNGAGTAAAARAFSAELLSATATDPARAVELVAGGRHPSVEVVVRQGAAISVDQARSIVARAALSAPEGDRKVVIVEEVHLMREAAPVLLKTLEEPTPGTFFVLLAEHVPDELVTIASRCLRVDFPPTPIEAMVKALEARGLDPTTSREVAAAAQGDLERALLLSRDDSLRRRRAAWYAVPTELDGAGATVVGIVRGLLAMIDDVQVPLKEKHVAETQLRREMAERYGTRLSGEKEFRDGQRRELRRVATDELRFGLATLAERYRDELAGVAQPRPYLEAIDAIVAATGRLARNVREQLLLESLLLRLPRVES